MAIETSELNKLQYSSFPKIFERFRKMAAENQGPVSHLRLPESILAAMVLRTRTFRTGV